MGDNENLSSITEPLLTMGSGEDSLPYGTTSPSPNKNSLIVEASSADSANTETAESGLHSCLANGDENLLYQPTTTRKELWSYYLYYNGDNGVGPGSYSQTLFQSVLTAAGHDPKTSPPEMGNCSNSGCVVPWGSGTRSVASIVLIANGICFAVMTLIFVSLGSAADYSSFGRWWLLALTVTCWAFQYGFMGIKAPSQWPAAMVLYIVSYIAYGATLVFYAAIFPRLASHMPHVRKAREEDLFGGKISQEEYDQIESLEKNHLSSVSTAHSNIGYLFTLAINLSVLVPLGANPYANNWALFLTNTYWVMLGVWWFAFQQPRPGPAMPADSSYWTIGWKQVLLALRDMRHLPQTFTYLVAFFLLADGLNTTGTLISIIQATEVNFSFLQITYLGISQACCSILSTFGFWYLQRRLRISTKHMFMITNFFSVLIPFWGMLGIWTNRVGYHNFWEFYFYNIMFGLFQAPYYAYAQTMMSEVTPRGHENMFFGLFGVTNRASSIIGPNIIQAIINATNNNWLGFPFLFTICAAASVVIWFVDVEKGRKSCRAFERDRKVARVRGASGTAVVARLGTQG